jgi:hypothetical protein
MLIHFFYKELLHLNILGEIIISGFIGEYNY